MHSRSRLVIYIEGEIKKMPELNQNAHLVSIFTLTFNQESYIGPCIESVLAQAYKNWEMVIVDDGSTDDTWSIIQKYALRDGRIKPYRRDNKGIFAMAEAYNWMLDQSSGGTIAILDGDDLWAPDKLARQTAYHFYQGFEFTFGLCVLFEVASQKRIGVVPSKNDSDRIVAIEDRESFGKEYLRGSFPIFAVTCMINRSCLIKAGGFIQPPYLPTTDYPTWTRVLTSSCRAHFINAELGFWRIQVGQTTWKRAREMALGTLRYALEFSGETDETALISPERKRFISDSLYRYAICSLNERNASGVRIALVELIKFKGYHHIFRFIAVLCVRFLRKSLIVLSRPK